MLQVRERADIRDNSQPEVIPYGRFDPFNAWRQTVYSGAATARCTISPLMASMQCFLDNNLEIEGRDILDTDPTENSLFHDYNHALIPYCSSDIWLGEETTTTSAFESGASQCSCFNYTTNSGPSLVVSILEILVNFSLLFVARPSIKVLLCSYHDSYGLLDANKVILTGSSAGEWA